MYVRFYSDLEPRITEYDIDISSTAERSGFKCMMKIGLDFLAKYTIIKECLNLQNLIIQAK